MDKLERYIQNHQEDFNLEPDIGHLARFQKKLNRFYTKTLVRRIRPVLQIAAVFVLFLLSGLWILEHTGVLPVIEHIRNRQYAEYKEAEEYYILQVNQKFSEIKKMYFIGDSLQKHILYNELNGMDSVYADLEHDLKMNPGDERLLQAMIEYYQTKLDALNTIIKQLSQLQNTKKTDHEKTIL